MSVQKSGTLLMLFFFLSCFEITAQFYEYGQPPSNLIWRQIESPNFNLIFPQEVESEAQYLTRILEAQYSANSLQLDHKPRKFPVILHNQTSNSNGFVTWAPRRTEFFINADTEAEPLDWLTHLSIHEFRHIVQTDKLNTGTTKFLTTLLGEQGIGPAVAMLPFWLLEGDAVYAETSLSKAGRGRSPSFEMPLKAQLLQAEKPWSFSKSYLGSYRDYVPDYYQLGYQMVSYARQEYGNDIWSGAFEFTGKKPFLLNPLYFYLKKHTQLSKKDLYRKSMHYLKTHWGEQSENREVVHYPVQNSVEKKLFTSYNHPQFASDDAIIALKSGLDIINRFVKIDSSGREELLFIPGTLNSGRFSYFDGKLVWDEYQPDIRWDLRSYSNIIEYDLKTRQKRILTRFSRLSFPVHSYSGDSLVAIENTTESDFYLTFISALDGGIFHRVPSPENVQLMQPSWVDKSAKILVIGLDNRGKSLLMYDRDKNNWEVLIPPSPMNISYPVSSGGRILLNASYQGVDNLYSFDPRTGEIMRITASEFGAFEPALSKGGELLAFSDYSAMGYNICVFSPDTLRKEEYVRAPISEQPFFRYGDSASLAPGKDWSGENALNSPVKAYPSEPYRKALNLFRFHSWSPFYFDYSNPDIDNPQVNPGLTLLSQNLLSTANTLLGYEYREGDHYLHTSFLFQGWFPVIDISHTWGGSPLVAEIEGIDNPVDLPVSSRLSINTWLPMFFQSGKWLSGFYPGIRLSHYNDLFYYFNDRVYKKGITYLEPSLYLYSFQKTAMRDYRPRWGFVVDAKSLSAPFEDEQRGSVSSLKTSFYVPGLFRSHSLRFMMEKQGQNRQRYPFGNLLTFPRGFEPLTSAEMEKLSIDYHLPLFYPDLSLEGFLYLTRIRANLFYDYVNAGVITVINNQGWETQATGIASMGIELNADYHLLRFLPSISSGMRASYRQNTKDFKFEFLFNVSLDRF